MAESEDIRNFAERGMQPVTSYAPARILLLGLAEAVFGLMVLGMGAITIWATWGGDMKPTKPGDMPEWWMYIVGAALGLGGVALFTSGLGRMLSGLARNCFFMAGPEGIALRMPKQGWFGRFRVVEYDLKWDQIAQFVRYIHRAHLIPVGSDLRIELKVGGRVVIARHYFRDSVMEIQQRLLAMQTTFGR
jgi:hypothetical protein